MGKVRSVQENYIQELSEVSRSQKAYARDAILWLLTRCPHSKTDISEHFGLPADIVSLVVDELLKAGRIEQKSGKQALLTLREPFKNFN